MAHLEPISCDVFLEGLIESELPVFQFLLQLFDLLFFRFLIHLNILIISVGSSHPVRIQLAQADITLSLFHILLKIQTGNKCSIKK